MRHATTLLLTCCMFSVSSAQAQYYHIDSEFTFVDTVGGQDPYGGQPRGTLYQSNLFNSIGSHTLNVFRPVINGNDVTMPLLSAANPYKGKRKLMLGWPNANEGTGDLKDKVMLQIGPHYNASSALNDWDPGSPLKEDVLRYTGFALYIPSTATMPIRPNRWLVLYQVYQVDANVRPPFAIYIERNSQTIDTVDLLFVLRDDKSPSSEQQTGNSQNGKESYAVTLDRGTWYEFIIYQKPSQNAGLGRLMVWMAEGNDLPPSSDPTKNAYRVVNYSGTWGYPPDPGESAVFSCQLGPYAAETPYKFNLHFDEIKFGTQYNQVNP